MCSKPQSIVNNYRIVDKLLVFLGNCQWSYDLAELPSKQCAEKNARLIGGSLEKTYE